MSASHSQYSKGLTGLILLIIITILIFSVLVVKQPQTGDLARIGGYLESSHGSRLTLPRTAFKDIPFTWTTDPTSITDNYDVLIFGDSFSKSGKTFNWINHFSRLTGLNIIATNYHSWHKVLFSQWYKSNPAKLVIFESVERDVLDVMKTMSKRTRTILDYGSNNDRLDPLLITPFGVDLENKFILPKKVFASFDERVSVSFDILKKTINRFRGHGVAKIKVFNKKPGTIDVFSSINQSELLFIKEDLGFRNLKQSHLDIGVKGYQKLYDYLLGHGTILSLLTIPNRFSVYRDYLTSESLSTITLIINRLDSLITLFNALPIFRTKVANGAQDVYWPMDTHISRVGSEILANGYVEWLIEQNIFLTSPCPKEQNLVNGT